MEDFEILTDAEQQAAKQQRSATSLDETDLAGIDAEVAARDNALKASLRQGVTVNPDEAARVKALSAITGVPDDVVGRNTEEVEGHARVSQLNRVLAESPILARQMTDPEFAKIAHDDAENLSLFERTLRTYLGASVKSSIESLLGTAAKLADTVLPTLSEQDAAVLFKDKPDELAAMRAGPTMFLSRFARAMQQASEASMANLNPDAKAAYGDLKYATLDYEKAAYLSPIKVVGDAIQSLPTTLALAVSAYLTKGVATRVEAQALEAGMTPELARQAATHAAAETMAKLGGATEGAAGFGQQAIQTREAAEKVTNEKLATSTEYQRLIGSGYSHDAARLLLSAKAADTAGLGGGVADALTAYFGGGFLGRIIGEGGALLKRVAKGFGVEAGTEAVQSGFEQLTQNAAVQHFLDPQQELLDGVAEQIAQGFVVGGVMGGAFGAAAGRKSAAERAAQDAKTLQRLFELAASDKLRERSPAEFAKFVQAAADEHGSSAVYVDAAVFAQAAQDKIDIATTMPETAKQLKEALAVGGDLRIPLGELTAALPGTGLENTLLQEMRMSPDAPTLRETQDKAFVEETQKAVEQAMAEHEFSTAQKQSAAVVEKELLGQLTTANRFTKDVNSAYARLMASFYTVQAARLGITPEEMYVKYPLRIQAEPIAGATMDQPVEEAISKAIEIVGDERFQKLGEQALLDARAVAAQTNAPFGQAEIDTTIGKLARRIVEAKQSGSTIFNQDYDNATGEALPNPAFVSHLAMQVAAAKMNVAPAAQWKAYINSLASKGVKKDEITLSGILDWLDGYEKDVDTVNEARKIKADFTEGESNIISRITVGEGFTLEKVLEMYETSPRARVWIKRAIRDGMSDDGNMVSWRYAEDFLKRQINERNEMNTPLGEEAMNVWRHIMGGNPQIAPVEKPGTAVVPVEPAKSVKIDTRVTKQAVLDYIAQNGVQVKTAILGAPKEEQEGFRKPNALVTSPEATLEIDVGKLPPGYGADVSRPGAITVLAPNGDRYRATSEEDAIAAAKAQATALQKLPALPDDYDYEINEEGQYIITTSNGDEITADTREEAMEAIDEAYKNNEGLPNEPSDEEIEEKAKELLNEDASEIAREYANESEYANYSFEVAFRPPAFKVMPVEGSRGIVDMFTGRETPPHYRVVKLDFSDSDLPGDDDVNDTDGSSERNRHNMPDDEEEFWDMFGEEAKEEPTGPEFETESEAVTWGEQNVGSSTPKWFLWDRESNGRNADPERENEGEYDSFAEANSGADSVRSARYDSEVEYVEQNIDEYIGDMDRYTERAREELERERNDEGPADWYTKSDYLGRLLPGWERDMPSSMREREDPEEKRLRLMHKDSYQSDGGTNYREVVIGVPNAESYNERDTTHFGHVFEGKTIAWARVKEHKAADGEPVLFIEEIQSQRAQAGREAGFKRNTPPSDEEQANVTKLRDKYYGLEERMRREVSQASDEVRHNFAAASTLLAAEPDDLDVEHREALKKWQEAIGQTYQDWKTAKRFYEDANDALQGGSVPRAPFTEDTQAWVALTVKRLIRYAVDRGLKRVVWTQGVEQVERYEGALRKAVTQLSWKKTEKGIEFEANGSPVKRNRNDQEQAVFREKELRSVVGPHIAQRVINDPNQEGVIEGEDIKIDDLWPAGFYGDARGLNANEEPAVLTIVANKILKSLGGGKVAEQPITINEEGSTFEGAPGFEISDKMAETVKKGLPLFQGEAQSARGQISFGDDIKNRPSIITLLQNADLSTFLHESGHFYLEVLADIASQPNAPAEVMGDMQKILDWFGIPTLANWREMSLEDKRPYHERFARGFESYLFSGKSPSTELQGLFSRFRAWLINVYKELTSLNVTLTDEVRGVFDRMLATNDEILQAEAARGYTPLFKTAAEMGATAEEWRSYQEQGMAATQEAVDLLQTRSLRDMKWLSNARAKILVKLQREANSKRKAIQREVTDEVRSQPIYAAIRFLTHGELADENRTNKERALLDSVAGQPNKLSIPDLKAMYGDHPAAPWRYLNTGKFGHLAAEDGLNPNMVAELFGFTSGDHLVRSILSVEPEAEVIQGMTDQRMLERYGDLSSPGAIEQAANEAIHNEARARFIATEARALAKAAGQRNIIISAAKEFAATLIARKKLREIRPAQYTSAETRAGRNAERAKTLIEKATEKRNQLVNHYAARAAFDALDEVQKGVNYLRRVGESKTIDVGYREQIQALLARFDLRPISPRDAARRASLQEWIDEQRKLGFEPVIDEDLANEVKRMPYREMPLEEFRGLVDAVKNIEHLGRLKHRLLSLQESREFAAVVDEAATSIDQHAKRTLREPLERTKWVKIKSGFAEFFAMHRKFAMMLREMDGHADNGVLWRLFGQPMNAAGDTEALMREAATKKLQALLAPVLKEGRMSEKRVIPELNGASLTREGRIMVALNMGNSGNLQRLLDGDNWTLDQAQAILNTLTKTEMDFVQAIWDYVGSFRDEIGAQQRRITGVAPEWVEARPVQTIHGEYKGGYIPAKYDTSRSTRSLSDEAAAGVMDQWRAKRGAAKTRDSFTKARANKVVDRPLRKDFGVVTQHITEVTHRLAWQEYLIDAQRLLRAGRIDEAIRSHYGPEVLKAMRDTIEDIAAGEVAAQNAFESSVNYLRTGATIAGLGWRITTSLLQPIGLTQSMVRIGPKYVARGLVEWLGDAVKMENTAKRIFEKSAMMRLRSKTMQREISEIRNVVAGKNSAIEASYFYLITKLQLVADIPTWLGQYHKAVELGADEKSAVAQADQAVIDAQSGGQIKDLAGIQRGGPMLKLFTNFYSFFNTTYNLTSEAVGRTKWKDPISLGRLATDLLLLYTVPAVLGTLLKAALHSGDDGADDEKKLVRQLIADQLTYMFGTMVGLREIAGTAQTALGLPGDYQGPASVRLFAELAKLGKQVNQGDVDEALLKAANNTAGILFHYPAGQIGATVDGIVTMADGKTSNPGALIVGSNKK